MINIIDLVLGIFILFYLIKNAGGVVKTIKNLAMIVLFLMFFGVIAQLVLNMSFAEATHDTLNESGLVKASHVLIKWIYPVIEWAAPQVDGFIKDNIMAKPTPDVSVPKVTIPNIKGPAIMIPQESLPKLSIEDFPKLK
ncbi:MAG: hypothetical protein ABH823_04405 [bacterium]